MKNINKINMFDNRLKRIISKFVSAVLVTVLFGTAFGEVTFFDSKGYNISETVAYAEEGKSVTLNALNKDKIDAAYGTDVSPSEPMGSTLTKDTLHMFVEHKLGNDTTITTAYYDIPESILTERNPSRKTVQIEVTYYDGGAGGYFLLNYDGIKDHNKQHEEPGNVWGCDRSYEKKNNSGESVLTDINPKYATKTFTIYDLRAGGGISDSGQGVLAADFSITAYLYTVYIKEVKVKVLNTISPISLNVESDSVGNIFFDGDERRFDLKFGNTSNAEQSYSASWSIHTYDDELDECTAENRKASGEIVSMSLGSGSEDTTKFYIPESVKLDYGCYTLKVDIKGTGIAESFEIPFSVCITNTRETRSNRLGVATHTGIDYDEGLIFDLLDKAGIGTVRTGLQWFQLEKYKSEPGDYDESVVPEFQTRTQYDDFFEQIEKHGMKATINLGSPSPNYYLTGPDENGVVSKRRASANYMPDNDSTRKAYGRALVAMLDMYGKNIDMVEILNEPEYEGSNKAGLDPTYYALLVAEASKAVRASKHNGTKIGAYVYGVYAKDEDKSEAQQDYVYKMQKELFDILFGDEKGANNVFDTDGQSLIYKYADGFIAHPYVKYFFNDIVPPRKFNIQTAAADANYLKQLLKAKGCGNRPIHYTEYGDKASFAYLGQKRVGWIRKGERAQAAFVARNTIQMYGANMGDKFFIYNFVNVGLSDCYSEQNFGLVKAQNYKVPYAAKPAYIAISAMSNMIGLCDTYDTVAFDDKKAVYKCTDSVNPNRTVYVFGAEEDESYTFTPDGDSAEFYDMYGNKLDGITKNGGSYNLTIGTEPMYAVVESGKPVISHTEFDEYTLVSARFPDKEIGDSVIVTAYDENGNLEDTRTVVLDGKKSCVIKFPFDNKVNHTVKFEAVRVSYSYEVQGSKTMKTDVEVDNSTGDMSVSARYLGGRQGDAVSLEVTDANGKALYYDQMYLDENLECSTEFKVDPSTRYIVTLGKVNHTVKFEVVGVIYSYEVQGSKTMKTDVEVNNSTGDMSVSARYLGGRQGDAVSLEVTDANGNALYYDQMYLDENLECSTEFKVDPSVRYIVTLGTEGLKKAHIVQKDVGQIMFTVKKGSNVINRFDEMASGGLNNVNPVVYVEFLGDSSGNQSERKFDLIIAGYSDNGTLSYAAVKGINDMSRDSLNSNKYSYSLNTANFGGAVKARFYLVDSVRNLRLLCEDIELK